ncbi:MAG: DUF4345 domain-containing protein [Pseudomonadota bacterium]
MIRAFLVLIGLMYVAFGVYSLVAPTAMTAGLGVDVSGPNGTFEMRGVFGGVSLGAAILCLAGAARQDMTRPALWFLVAYMGGYCLARLGSVLLGDWPTPSTWAFVAFEAASFILAVAALRTKPVKRKAPP